MEASLSKVVLQIVRVLVNPQSTFKGQWRNFQGIANLAPLGKNLPKNGALELFKNFFTTLYSYSKKSFKNLSKYLSY